VRRVCALIARPKGHQDPHGNHRASGSPAAAR
jgi:hypothetical protein